MGAIEFGILFPAFLAGMLVLSTHVPLGQQVLARGIVFIDLAIAQVAGLGVTAADAFGFEPQGWRAQAAGVCAAPPGAFLPPVRGKKRPQAPEDPLGLPFVLPARRGLLVPAIHPPGGARV